MASVLYTLYTCRLSGAEFIIGIYRERPEILVGTFSIYTHMLPHNISNLYTYGLIKCGKIFFRWEPKRCTSMRQEPDKNNRNMTLPQQVVHTYLHISLIKRHCIHSQTLTKYEKTKHSLWSTCTILNHISENNRTAEYVNIMVYTQSSR